MDVKQVFAAISSFAALLLDGQAGAQSFRAGVLGMAGGHMGRRPPRG